MNTVKTETKTDSTPDKHQAESIERNRAEQNINKASKKQFSSNSKASTSETSEKEKLWSMLLNQNVAKNDVKNDQPNAVVTTFMKNVISKESTSTKNASNEMKLPHQKIGEKAEVIEEHNVTASGSMAKTPNDCIKFIEAISKSMKISNNNGDKSTIDGTVMWMESNESGNSDSDGCTDTLKKWLRISDDKSTGSSTKSQKDTVQTASINVQDMFKVDTYALPKPPQTWRTASVDQNVQHTKQNVVHKNSNEQIVNKSGSRLFYASSNHHQQYNGSLQQTMQMPPQSKHQNFIYHPQPQSMQHRYPVPPPMLFNRPSMPSNANFHHQPPNFFYNKVSTCFRQF